MVPMFRKKYLIVAIKYASLVFVLLVGSFILIKGNFIARVAVFLLVPSALVYGIWTHKHKRDSTYDNVGYWSGLDDFGPGIDLHCFDDLNFEENDFEVLSDDFFDKRPV